MMINGRVLSVKIPPWMYSTLVLVNSWIYDGNTHMITFPGLSKYRSQNTLLDAAIIDIDHRLFRHVLGNSIEPRY